MLVKTLGSVVNELDRARAVQIDLCGFRHTDNVVVSDCGLAGRTTHRNKPIYDEPSARCRDAITRHNEARVNSSL